MAVIKKFIIDFSHMIIYSNKYFKNWKPLIEGIVGCVET